MDNTNDVEEYTVGQLIDTLAIGQVGVVLNNIDGAISPPTGVFWDEGDRNRMKYIYPDGSICNLYGLIKTDGEGNKFIILDSMEDYFKYAYAFLGLNTNKDEGV